MTALCPTCDAYWACEHQPSESAVTDADSIPIARAQAMAVWHTQPRDPQEWDRAEDLRASIELGYTPTVPALAGRGVSRRPLPDTPWFWQASPLPEDQLAEHARIRLQGRTQDLARASTPAREAAATFAKAMGLAVEQVAAAWLRFEAELETELGRLAEPRNRAERRQRHPYRPAAPLGNRSKLP